MRYMQESKLLNQGEDTLNYNIPFFPNIRFVIVVLLFLFSVNSSIANTSSLPTYEQAKKLAAAAWKSPPRSIDITYYEALIDNTRTEEKLRQTYKDTFDKMYGSDEKLNTFMLENKERSIQNNVNRQLIEQEGDGLQVKYRVRFDGKSFRVERVYGSPDRTSVNITGEREFRQGKKLNINTPFEETFIFTETTTGNFEEYIYSHESRNAQIQKIEYNPIIPYKNGSISDILWTPNALLQLMLGTQKDNLATEPFDINEVKIEKLCSGTLEDFNIKIQHDVNEPESKDRIEISLINNEKKVSYTSLMICAKKDYSKVYYYQTPNPATGKPPVLTRTCSNFDAQGFPHNIVHVEYDSEGEVLNHKTYVIENVRFNIQIPEDVFKFNPPEGYEVTDYRLSEDERKTTKIESLKKKLMDKNSGGRTMALMDLREYLKDNPAELKEISISMLKDERNDIRKVALVILRTLLKDNPEELKNIANSMLDDEDRTIQLLVANILKEVESNKEQE